MTDSSTADELPPQTNGITNNGGLDEDEKARMRPADIDADVREMERRKRVEMIMNSKLFREELERIIETQLKDGTGPSGLLQQISDMVGVNKQAGNVFKNSSCVIPINDIRGIESMGYAKGEKILRCKLAAVFRLIDLYGWTQGSNTLITARLNQEEEQFLVNPYGMLFHEITASSLIKVDMQGNVLEQGTTNFSVNVSSFSLHAAVHAARPDIRCIIHVHTPSVVSVSALKHGLLPLSQESVVIGETSTHPYLGGLLDTDEKDKLARNLGPINKVLLLSNQGALCCGDTIEEAFFNAKNTVLASESQLKLLPVGLDNLVLLNDEARKKIYDAAHRAPESTPRPDQPSLLEAKVERKWRVGGIEFEALMRMMDNAGFRTGYIYRHPLVKGEPPKPRNDVEVPPAVSSLGYLLEEEELYRQGLWRKLEGGRKGHDRSRWLNSPNVYQKVEILETGTPDPKKITKWVADGSPSHSSTPVRIDAALQFVPQGTNPKEFKKKQQEIKDYRRADKISAGPQSHILEGVTWEEARKMQDAAVTQTGDHVVLMGAASKGIIQRGHQHNAMVYKSPYAKNPFDSVTDEELEDYKKVVEKKSRGEYDTDYSESEGLSSSNINKRMDSLHLRSPTSVTSETEEESRDEPRILRIETTTAPKPSQPEVVLSDVTPTTPVEQFLRAERHSVNSSRNDEDLTHQIFNIATRSCYRTQSHAGFPKGSYIIPNPLHFHIVHETKVALIKRPTIVSLVPYKNIAPSRTNHRPKNNHINITKIKLIDTHPITVNISLDSLKAFILPFAEALNLIEIPVLNSQACQTAYMNNFQRSSYTKNRLDNIQYTPLYVDSTSNTLHVSDTHSSFEKEVLQNMEKSLVRSFNKPDDKLPEKYDFTELEQYENNEGFAELAPNENIVIADENNEIIQSSESSSSIIFKDNDSSFSGDKTSIDSNTFDIFEQGENKINASTKAADQLENSIIDDENMDDDVPDIKTTDEGVADLSEFTHTNLSINNIHNISKFGSVIADYLGNEGFELSDLIILPEIKDDEITTKLLTKLKDLYKEYYSEVTDDETKTQLRFSIANYVLNLLRNDDRLKNDSNDSDNAFNISDRLFVISEFLSELLDKLFNAIDADNFTHFSEDLLSQDRQHSTPEKRDFKPAKESNEKKYSDPEISVTAFKRLSKNLSESFWYTVSPLKQESPAKRPVVNVDNIPNECEIEQTSLFEASTFSLLRNSIDNISSQEKQSRRRSLSPIMEESIKNLFNTHLSPNHKVVEESNSSFEYEFLYDNDSSLNDVADSSELGENNSESLNLSDTDTEVNVAVHNEIQFYRGEPSALGRTSRVVFTTNVIVKNNNDDNKCNEFSMLSDEDKENMSPNNSGDWMGYEKAKF